MILEELENGLYLDLPLQQYIEKFTTTNALYFSLIDELHASENLKYFSLITIKISPLKNKTIYNPPLETIQTGTDSTNPGTNTGTGIDIIIPIPGTIQYRLSFFQYKGYSLIRIQNLTEEKENFLFKTKDLDFWKLEINKIKKDYYN